MEHQLSSRPQSPIWVPVMRFLSQPGRTLQWPVLEHDGKRMNESREIMIYLDAIFPHTPQLVAPGAHKLQHLCRTCAAWRPFPEPCQWLIGCR